MGHLSIVAVHGLDGDSVTSWTDLSSGTCWLSHPELLPHDIPNARILTFGYDVNTVAKRTSTATLTEHADSLVESLARKRRESEVSMLNRARFYLIKSRTDTESCHYFHSTQPRRHNCEGGEDCILMVVQTIY